jgi:glutaminyl-tRNA synthetase
VEFVESIQADVRWLGFDWEDRLYFASDYFERLYQFAIELIEKGLAYVCELTAEETRAYRGHPHRAGRDSPYRDRSVAENLDLFRRMRAGEFPDGARTLRAKIDMASPNINLRDPVLYRIRHGVVHHQTGSEWCLYPMYDYTHPISDALEGITHSICTLEFEDHRPFYDWVRGQRLGALPAAQIEFSRLNLEYTVMSKRKLTQLVSEGHRGGLGRPAHAHHRGAAPARLHAGLHPRLLRAHRRHQGRQPVEMAVLESAIREDLDAHAPAHGGAAPLKVVIENYPRTRVESSWRSPTTPRTRPWAAQSPSAGRSTSTATTSPRSRPRASSAWSRAARCGCATPT